MPWAQNQHRHVKEVAIRRAEGVQNLRSRPTFDRSPVRESRTPGSVRGALSNGRPYRDRGGRRRPSRSVHNDYAGWAIEPRKLPIAEAEAVEYAEGDMSSTVMRGAVALPWSKTPSRINGIRRNLGDLTSGRSAYAAPVRVGKVKSRSR
jgi:hypothetical protein